MTFYPCAESKICLKLRTNTNCYDCYDLSSNCYTSNNKKMLKMLKMLMDKIGAKINIFDNNEREIDAEMDSFRKTIIVERS